MMRKQFPVPREGPTFRIPQWSPPPPTPVKSQSGSGNSSSETLDSSPQNSRPRSRVYLEPSFENWVHQSIAASKYTVDCEKTPRPTSSTRLSFGSIFSQLRRLPPQRHCSASAVSSCGLIAPPSTPPQNSNRLSLRDLPIPPSTLTNHQASKNLQLLRAFTDQGPYSRVQAMTIASVLYNRKVTENDIRGDLTPKQKFCYKRFCLEIEDKLEMITASRSPSARKGPFSERTLRKIWHLYALYTKALSDQIRDEGTAKADITSRAIAHLVKRAIAGGPEEGPLKEVPLDQSPDSTNPVLASLLKDPIQAFLIVYGRYCSTGKVYQCERLRKLTHFNEIVQEFFQKLVAPPENKDIDTYILFLRQQQQCQQKWSSTGTFTGYGSKSASMHSHKGSGSKRSLRRRKSSQQNHHQVAASSSSLQNLGDRGKDDKDSVHWSSHQEKLDSVLHQHDQDDDASPPMDNDVKSLQRKIQMLDGKKRICLTGCRYEVLPIVAKSAGFEIVGENDLWNINWSDTPLAQEKISQMRRVQDMYSVFWGLNAPLQRCNHFPGMYEICRKDRLGRNLNRLKRLFPNDYNFFPETFDLPTEQSDLIAYQRRRKRSNVTFIIKPESGCQGKGIFLLRNLKKLSPFAKCVCQVYVPHPFLIDGYKFDQRIYVLITCVDPLRLYIYDEGIARFATVKYEVPTEENLEVVYMHLTNYSLNKFSESYVREGDGSKRTLSSIYQWMATNGYDVEKLKRDIDDIVVKTLLCAAPTLKHNYKTSFPKRDRGSSCFELLGFDILLDRHLNPILLEVNHSPSFNLDLPVDHTVKTALLKDMLNMVYLGEELKCPQGPPGMQQNLRKKKKKKRGEEEDNGLVSDALQRQFKHEIKHKGMFRLIYSSDKPGRFHKLSNEDGYCGYNIGVQLVGGAAHAQQVVFDRDTDWEEEPRKTTSTIKMTKSGKKYVETKLVREDWEQKQDAKFREVGGGGEARKSKSGISQPGSDGGKPRKKKTKAKVIVVGDSKDYRGIT